MIAFFLGSHPDVSLAELRIAFAKKEEVRTQYLVLFDISEELVLEKFDSLGGVPRVGKVLDTLELPVDEEKVIAQLKDSLLHKKRKEYVMSLYSVKFDKKRAHHQLKQEVTGVKYDGDFAEPQHSPAAVAHVMARGGYEYILVDVNKKALLIETLQVQDPKFWTIIDAERPGRDMKIGMLPAKLARIMVNLTGATKEDVIWDPFVGQATIAMQAAAFGIKAVGTDKSQQSLQVGKQNIDWLKQEMQGVAQVTLQMQPIERAQAPSGTVHIATEPYLGRARFKPFQNDMLAKREWREIERLYRLLMEVADRSLKSGQRIVLAKPMFAFIAKNKVEWYNPALPMPSNGLKVPALVADLGPLLWQNRDSVVGRQIIVLEKS
jgi:tRNA G10  N-methylase Trm11